MKSLYSKLTECETSGDEAALCTIVHSSGSTPRKAGAKMLVYGNGRIFGSVGGGALEQKVIKDALTVMEQKKPRIFTHALVQDHGMCCGGSLDLFIEPIVKKKKLYIFGAGHIGKALSIFARDLDFNVTVYDERAEAFSSWKPKGVKQVLGKHRTAVKNAAIDNNTFIAVVTHKHAYDREIVGLCAGKPHAYLGMIGSRRKVEMAKKVFSASGLLTVEQMERIDWPMGLDIKADTPEEIAIAILAKLIDTRNRMLG